MSFIKEAYIVCKRDVYDTQGTYSLTTLTCMHAQS